MEEVLIELQRIGKSYRKRATEVHALQDLSLTVNKGEFVAILGPSGSGKSTLLNIIGTLDNPSSGSYVFDGKDITKLDDTELSRFRAERIGFVFQSFNLLENLSAMDNVAMPARYAKRKLSKQQVQERAVDLLGQVGLAERVGHSPGELSGGEEQRVAIARALMNNPDLILADEPTGSLDSKSHAAILGLLQELNQAGKTIIAVSHNPDIVEVASRVVELKDGRRVQ
jgi:putative ABC transport system ATP-binding protein